MTTMDVTCREIRGGLYLVVDPMPGLETVLPKVKAALEGGVDVIQLWNHWNTDGTQEEFISALCKLAHQYHVPVLINENWQWLHTFPLDGIHFDTIPQNLADIKEQINRPLIIGITCGNEQETIQWAVANRLSYLSFCSMFPSPTANSCELVAPDLVCKTCAAVDMPVYVAGGITSDTIPSLLTLGISGVAIASDIMNTDDPQMAANKFSQLLKPTTKIK